MAYNTVDYLIDYMVEDLTNKEIVDLYNEYCSGTMDIDYWIYRMEDFNDVFSGNKPWEIITEVLYGDFRMEDTYFSFNRDGSLVSFSNPRTDINSPIDIKGIAEYCYNNDEDLGDTGIREILDIYE